MEDIAKELRLSKFLDEISNAVFVKSTNSVTDKVEMLNPAIEDQEATIKISGEWDREDLKNILASL